jgi:hypothetical protein
MPHDDPAPHCTSVRSCRLRNMSSLHLQPAAEEQACSPQSSISHHWLFCLKKTYDLFCKMIQNSAGDIFRYLTAITRIKTQEKNTVDTYEENKRLLLTGIAWHWHRGRCRRLRHSGVQHLNLRTGALVPNWVTLFQ